jgi:hypothetical protein
MKRTAFRFLTTVAWLGAFGVLAETPGEAKTPDWLRSVQRTDFDGQSNDLATAGLGAAGVAAPFPHRPRPDARTTIWMARCVSGSSRAASLLMHNAFRLVTGSSWRRAIFTASRPSSCMAVQTLASRWVSRPVPTSLSTASWRASEAGYATSKWPTRSISVRPNRAMTPSMSG